MFHAGYKLGQLSALMKDHGQQARASENFAGPVDFETPRPNWPVDFFYLS